MSGPSPAEHKLDGGLSARASGPLHAEHTPVVMPADLPPWKLVPRPGPVFGPYPMRATEMPPKQMWRAWFKQQLRLPSRPGAARRREFLAKVQAALKQLDTLDATARKTSLLQLRMRLAKDGFTDTLTAHAFARVAYLVRRQMGFTLFDTQYLASWTMLGNCLIEMATGEGKTQAVLLTAATAALASVPVHILTSNDYLAERDAETLKPILVELGLSVGCVTARSEERQRRAAYGCDVTYATAREVAFDYLRDRLGASPEGAQSTAGHRTPVLRGMCMAVLDEADSVLIDEAGTPMILSQQTSVAGETDSQRLALYLARQLRTGEDIAAAPDGSWRLTDSGRAWLDAKASTMNNNWQLKRYREEMVTLALSALYRFKRDVDYVVHDGEIQIVDVNTGRRAEGRAWSRGLHQLVGLKEGLKPSPESHTVMQTTYQHFFPRYLRLCGLSGTLAESRTELLAVYGMQVVPIPLRRRSLRNDWGTLVYTTSRAKWSAVVKRAKALSARGRPVLIGTGSVADSELISALLTQQGVKHQVLNARQDAEEAHIVSLGGQEQAVTVATQMAGRGTDIPLGPGVADRGGLHVINAYLHPARRIDRQLNGRAGRQGQPGSHERIVSLEDEPLVQGLPAFWLRFLKLSLRGFPALGQMLAGSSASYVQQHAEAKSVRARWSLLQHETWLSKSLAWAGRHHWD